MSWYDDYLQSDHWLATRDAKLEQAKRRCERCGEYAKRRPGGRWVGLHVHHLTYERVGQERMDDLEVLCIHCHQVEHGHAEDTERNRLRVQRRLAVGVVEDVLNEYGDYDWTYDL